MKRIIICCFLFAVLLSPPIINAASFNIKDPSTYPSYQRQINYTGGDSIYGEDVRFIQTALKDFGYSLEVDGYYGPITKNVVLKFQTDSGMAGPNGIFGPLSWNKMIEKLKAKYPVRIIKLELINGFTKTEYYKGDAIDKSGVKLKATYSDGTTTTVTSNYGVTGNTNNLGNQTIAISYQGKSVTTTISVIEKPGVKVTGIEIENYPSKTSYIQNENLNTSGLSIKVRYSNNTSKIITSGFTVSGNTYSVGTRTITVSYENFSTTYQIIVSKKVSEQPNEEIDQSKAENKIEKIIIETFPDKYEYQEAEVLNLDGLVVKAIYTDKSSVEVKDYSVETTELKVGKNEIEIKYKEFSTKFDVIMKAQGYVSDEALKSISIYKTSNDKFYSKESKLNKNDIVLKLEYDDKTEELINNNMNLEYDFSKSNVVKVKYNDQETSFKVKIVPKIVLLLYNNLYYVVGGIVIVIVVTVSIILIIKKKRGIVK